MEIRSERRIRVAGMGFEIHEAIQHIQLLAQFPDAAAQGVEERAIFQFRHTRAEIPKSRSLVAKAGGTLAPLRRMCAQQVAELCKQLLGIRTIFMREVEAIAETLQVFEPDRLANRRETRQPLAHGG